MNFYHDDTGRRFGTVKFSRMAPLHFGGGGSSSGKVEPTEYEQAFAEVAQKKWQIYQNEYKPFLDQFISSADDFDSTGAKLFVRGAAATSTGAEFDRAAQTAEANLQTAGINPNSGAYKARVSGLRDVQGAATGENVVRAENELGDQYVKTLQNISAVGRGESAQAQAGLSDVAELSAEKARGDALKSLNESQNMKAAAGMGLSAAALFGGGGGSGQPVNQTDYNNARTINYNQSLA
jgi:hypothetical protein